MSQIPALRRSSFALKLVCALLLPALIGAPEPSAAGERKSVSGKTTEVAPTTGKPKATSAVARAVAAKGSDFEQMAIVLGLEGAKLEHFRAALTARDEGYKKWLTTAAGQSYDAAQKELNRAKRAGGNPQRLADAQAKYEPLRAEQEKVRRELRREFNKQFEPGQLQLWAGHMLYTAVMPRFEFAKFGDDQKQQAQAICCVLAEASVDDAAIGRDPYLAPEAKLQDRAYMAIERLVVRADQREKAK